MALPTQAEPSFLHELAKHAPEADKAVWVDVKEKSLRDLNSTPFPHKKN